MRWHLRLLLLLLVAATSGCQTSPVSQFSSAGGYHYGAAALPRPSRAPLSGAAAAAETTVEAAAAVVPMALHLTGRMFPGI